MTALTKKGITFNVTLGGTSGAFHDGNNWCLVSDQVTSITPAKAGAAGTLRNGFQLNVRGNSRQTGMDGRFPYGDFNEALNNLTLPYTMQALDVIIKAKSAPELPWTPSANGFTGSRGRSGYWTQVDGISNVDEMATLTCLRTAPGSPIFRPPAFGGYLSRILRDNTITEATADYTILPNVIDPTLVTGTPPDITLMKALFSDFNGEVLGNWTGREIHPDLQNPGYGGDFVAAVSNALICLCSSTVSSADKAILGRSLIQWGLDLASAWIDGRLYFANGGHCQGRKALLMVAGALLWKHPISTMLLNIDNTLAGLGFTGARFHENDAYYLRGSNGWWWSTNWPAVWKFTNPNVPPGPYPPLDGTYFASPPSAWSTEAQTGNSHNSQVWATNGYFGQSVGSTVGTALCMRLMGLTRYWSPAADAMVAQYVAGVPAAVDAAMQAVGVNAVWGTSSRDVSCGASANYQARAWNVYSQYPGQITVPANPVGWIP
jgi:hypothetical protein